LHPSTETQRDEAETVALKAVEYLFSDKDRLRGFLGTTGIAAEDVKLGLSSPDMQAGIVEYILSREDILIEFCEVYEIEPEFPKIAAAILSGVTPDW